MLNVSTSCVNSFEQELIYKTVPVEDSLTADIFPWLEEACAFIGEFLCFPTIYCGDAFSYAAWPRAVWLRFLAFRLLGKRTIISSMTHRKRDHVFSVQVICLLLSFTISCRSLFVGEEDSTRRLR